MRGQYPQKDNLIGLATKMNFFNEDLEPDVPQEPDVAPDPAVPEEPEE